MTHYAENWTPEDEVEFMRWLVRANAPTREQPRQSIHEKFARRQRVEALHKHLRLLPLRHFPGWRQAAVAAVVTAGQQIYARAVKELEGTQGG